MAAPGSPSVAGIASLRSTLFAYPAACLAMCLYYSPTSPYARKTRIVAIEKGLAGGLTMHALDPLKDPPELLAANPLAKVPCLLLDDGTVLLDSPVICEYLDSLAPEPVLVPAGGAARWDVLRRQALADGILDLAVALRLESLRPAAQQSPEWQGRWRAGILRSVEHLAQEQPAWPALDLGTLAVACALSYLDFRHPTLDWRAHAPPLDTWLEGYAARPSFKETQPPM